MKKIILSITAIFIFSTAFVSAQSLDEVLDKYYEVLGQKTLLASKSSKSTGKMIQMGLEIPFVIYSVFPDNFRLEATFQDMTLIQAFDGEKGWSTNPFAGITEPQDMSADELKSAKVQADYEGMLWNWKDKGYKVSLEDNEEVEGADCFVVKAVSEDEDVYTYYFDTESYVPIKMNSKVKMQGQVMESDTFMSNYQEGEGFVFAGKIETKMNGQVVSTIVIDEVTLGVDIDSSIFDKPAK